MSETIKRDNSMDVQDAVRQAHHGDVVRDSDGVSVFSSASKKKEPAELIFSVPNKMFILLTKADNIRSNSIKIFPVPRNQEYTENHGETKITSTEMQEFIESKSDDTFNTVISDIDQKCYNE